ncbi:MAG: SGNH/GDSL hydrolase family protein [Bacteroidetes bacterium]|nr:SGNH/GDSL hydrolase family protein [Bacteroidota bacterium]
MSKLVMALAAIILLSMTPARKNRIIFFGDSITQMGVNKGGYIDRMQTYLSAKGISDKYELIGAGVGGNKVYDLYLRLDEDVLDKRPAQVLIYVGVNDVWHKQMGTGTDLDKFERFYEAIIKKCQARKIKVIAVTPLCIGELKNNANPQDTDMNSYCDVIRKLATAYHCGLVDLRKEWMEYEQAHNQQNQEKGLLTTDRVHLTDAGSQLVTDAVLKALAL